MYTLSKLSGISGQLPPDSVRPNGIDRPNIHFKQHSHKLLRQPDGFILDAHLYCVFTRLLGEDQEFGGAVADLQFFSFMEYLRSVGSLFFGDATLRTSWGRSETETVYRHLVKPHSSFVISLRSFSIAVASSSKYS